MKKLVLFILISATLFSTMEVVLKVAGNQLDAFQLTFIRFLIGGTFLLPFALLEIKKYGTVITKKDILHMLAMGVVCICISMVFFQLGVENSKASTAAVIFCINPMFTMLFVHFMTEEKLNRIKVIALGFGLLGIVFMINPLHLEAGNTFLGFAYTILAALTFGLYSAMGRTSIRRLRGITQTSISFLLGSVVMIPVLLIMHKPIIAGVTTDNIWMVLYIGIMITGLGYLFYFLAMEVSDAATASIVFFVKPALAPVIAVIALSEVVGVNGLIGIILIFVGSYINLREQRTKKKENNDEKVDD
jgi:drug/metabolite transporter (DMT)-like permease